MKKSLQNQTIVKASKDNPIKEIIQDTLGVLGIIGFGLFVVPFIAYCLIY